MLSKRTLSKLFVLYVVLGVLSRIVGNTVNMIVSGISFAVILAPVVTRGETVALAFFMAPVLLSLFAVELYNGFFVMVAKKFATRRFTKILIVTRAIWVLIAFGIMLTLVMNAGTHAATTYPGTLAVIAGLLIFGNLPMLILHALELRTLH